MLKDKVAVVTGSSSGIGEATAKIFGKEGAKLVVVAGQNRDAADAVADEIRLAGGEAVSEQCDVSQENQVQSLFTRAIEVFGRVDILVNSAGVIGPALPMDKMPADEWDRVFGINMRGTFLCCKHAIPIMLGQKEGSVINLSSTAGMRSSLVSPCYSATKGAIISFTRSIALAYARHGVRINCICPGTIETPMSENFFQQQEDVRQRDALVEKFKDRHPLGRFGTAREVAQGALFLASQNASFVTGINLVIDGGISL